MSEVQKVSFVKSSSSVSDCPKPDKPEYAFIGRSNVGKSSLINMICGRKGLAHVSATPGKTVTINHFLVNDQWYIVDLPGYGYARRSRGLREQWSRTLSHYLVQRSNLQCVFVLVDSRIEPQQSDIDFINSLGKKQVPCAIVFTKTDKLKKDELEVNAGRFREVLHETWEEMPTLFFTSSVKQNGKEDLLEYIELCNREARKFIR